MTKGVLIDTKEGKRVVKGLGYYETPEIENLKQLVKISTEKHGDAIAFRFKDKNGNITGKHIMNLTGILIVLVRL